MLHCTPSAKKFPNKKSSIILILVALLSFLILLAGCTEMTRAQKNLCYSLTSQSYGYVPTCETEKSCFEKVNPMFNTKLGYQEESDLYALKNNVARSWYFYNKAVKEIKVIQNLCAKGNAEALGGEINQLMYLMDTSFTELDLAMKKSFNLISAEEKLFSSEKIDLVKEEALYESLVSLRQILSELNTGATNSDTYTAFYMKKADAFAKTSFSKTQTQLVEKTPFWIDAFSYSNGTILQEIGVEEEGFFPFISVISQNVFEYLKSAFFYQQNISALQSFPASEYIKLYSDLGGNNNSALKRFADLQNQLSKNYAQTKTNIKSLNEAIEKKQVFCLSLLSETNTSEEFVGLASKLLNSKISATDFNSSGDCMSKNIISLNENKNLAKITVGEELSALKEINNLIDEEIANLTYKKTEFFELLANACDKKAEETQKIDEEYAGEEANTLLSNSKFFASKTLNSTQSEKLQYCKNLVNADGAFQTYLSNYELYDAQKKDLTKECVAYLQTVFANSELNELSKRFEQLKKTDVTKDNLIWFFESCESIRKQVDLELRSDETLQKIESNFAKLKEVHSQLSKASAYFNSPAVNAVLLQTSEKIRNYQTYFYENKILIDKASQVKDFLLSGINESIDKLEALFESSIIEYAKSHFEILTTSGTVIEIGEDSNYESSLFVPNPFKPVRVPFSVSMNSLVQLDSVQSPCIDSFTNKTKVVSLSCLPLGGIKTKITSFANFSTEEKNIYKLVSNEEGIIQRNITIKSEIIAQRLLLSSIIPTNTKRVIVLVNGEAANYYFDASKVFFVVENASAKTQLVVFFYVEKMISTSLKLKETQTGDYGDVLVYELSAQNTLSSDVSATLTVNLPQKTKNSKIKIMENNALEQKFVLSENKIFLQNINFESGEIKFFRISIAVDTVSEFYTNGLEEQLAYFQAHDMAEEYAKLISFLQNINQKSANELFAEWEKNNILIKTANDVELENAKKSILFTNLENAIGKLKNMSTFLKNIGFESDADAINQLIDSIIVSNESSISQISSAVAKIAKFNLAMNEKLQKRINVMSEYLQTVSARNNDSNVALQIGNFLEYEKQFNSNFVSDPQKAQNLFSNMENIFSDVSIFIKEFDSNSKLALAGENKKINLLVDDCTRLIEWLTGELYGKDSQLIKEKFISPITQSRLAKLKLLVFEVKSSDANNSDKIIKLTDIRSELILAGDEIKRQAIVLFNKSIDLQASKNILSESKKLIDSNRFVDAYLLLSEGREGFESQIPFEGFIPVGIIILVAVLLRNSFKKKEKSEDEKKKLILEEWND